MPRRSREREGCGIRRRRARARRRGSSAPACAASRARSRAASTGSCGVCSRGKLGRPCASSATISPSMTAGSGPRPASTRVSSGYFAVMSLPLRARRCRRRPSQMPMARMPSHFTSTHGPQRRAASRAMPGVLDVSRASAASFGRACSDEARRARTARCLVRSVPSACSLGLDDHAVRLRPARGIRLHPVQQPASTSRPRRRCG